ncbi:hypothetical protein J7K92_02160 [bacterium]|nr:hypothetical protein [bacterium]
MDELQEIRQKIINSQSVLLVTKSGKLTLDLISAFFCLFYTLKRIGKKVNIYPETIKNKFSLLPHPIDNLDTYILEISPPNNISELYYQKSSESFRLLITLSKNSSSSNNIRLFSLEDDPLNLNVDLIISLGVRNLEELGEYYEKNFKTFFEGFILNIDNQKDNFNFGQINWIKKDMALSEIVHQLAINLLPKTEDKILLENLFVGIIDYYKKDPEKILQVFTLAQRNALEIKNILRLFLRNPNPEVLTFSEKVLKRIKVIGENNIPLVILTKKEFADIDRQKIIYLIKMLRVQVFNFPSLLILWESHADLSSLGGVFYFPEKETLVRLASKFGGQTNGKALLFQIPKEKKEKLIQEISSC